MSGGKETPRQKMIGMMYLVLTALLALNVSSTVIEKFIFLNDSLERANKEAEGRNSEILEAMRSSVEEKGNKAEDVAVIEQADKLRAEVSRVVQELEKYKELFIEETGGFEEGFQGDKHHIVGKTNYDKVGHLMMPEEEGGQGHGKEMKELLTNYRTFVTDLMKAQEAGQDQLSHFGNMTPDAEEDPVYREDPNQEGKKWSQLAFEYSPTHAGLATVSELQAEVLGFETRTLDYLKSRTGMKDITFDQIVPMVLPVAQRVISGSTYEAEMFIAASSSSADPKMKLNGRDIPVTAGKGKVSFPVDLNGGEDVGNGVKKKSFRAEIIASTPAGDTTFVSNIEYYVVKPAIVISSNTAVALYRNCANEVRVDVPGLSGNYNPSFGGNGAQFIKGNAAGELNIIPNSNARKVKLSVSNAGQKIGDKEFSVKEIPAPAITVKRGNNAVNPTQPIPTGTTSLRVDAVSDSDFASGHPKDARFVVLQGEASLLSGGLVRRKIPFRNGNLDLRSIASNVRKGDALVIEIQRVGRRNFLNKDENFPKFQRFVTVTY